ncbi:hypothetical protein E4U36_007560, partial [Claviceps purpurea]
RILSLSLIGEDAGRRRRSELSESDPDDEGEGLGGDGGARPRSSSWDGVSAVSMDVEVGGEHHGFMAVVAWC